jgi:hypothetical protein
MKKSFLLIFISAISIVIIQNACKKDKAKITLPVAVGFCDTITYSKHIAPIVASSCAISGCHKSGSTGSSADAIASCADLQNEFTNKNLTYTSTSILGKSLNMSGPSYAGLTPTQINLFVCWLEKNAPCN